MSYLALRNLWQQKLRLALSIGGVALAIALILLLNGFLAGVYRQVTAYLDHTPADFVVAQDGVTNLLGARSLLPSGVESCARGIPSVDSVIPILSQFVILDIHDKKVVAYLIGYEPDAGGGPWQLKAGRLPEDDDEVVLDWVMAQTHGFGLEDTIEILDKDFLVVGFSEGTHSWMASYLFMQKRAASRLLLRPDAASYLLLTLQPGANAEAVEARLRRRLRNLEVLPVAVVKQNDVRLLVKVFALPLRLMVSIAFAVGTAILGMVIYSATAERQREYGVLKAVGAQNRHLYALVIQQGVIIALGGVAFGTGFAWLAAQAIMRGAPKFLILLQGVSILITAASGILMGILAALLPARQVGGLDPAHVFRH